MVDFCQEMYLSHGGCWLPSGFGEEYEEKEELCIGGFLFLLLFLVYLSNPIYTSSWTVLPLTGFGGWNWDPGSVRWKLRCPYGLPLASDCFVKTSGLELYASCPALTLWESVRVQSWDVCRRVWILMALAQIEIEWKKSEPLKDDLCSYWQKQGSLAHSLGSEDNSPAEVQAARRNMKPGSPSSSMSSLSSWWVIWRKLWHLVVALRPSRHSEWKKEKENKTNAINKYNIYSDIHVLISWFRNKMSSSLVKSGKKLIPPTLEILSNMMEIQTTLRERLWELIIPLRSLAGVNLFTW